MSDVPGREELEAELARKLGKIFKVQMARLLELMGDPPHMENVPQSFWDTSSKEFNDVVIPFLERQYLEQASRTLASQPAGVDWALMNQRAMEWARQYSFELVRGINATTRGVLSKAVETYFEQGLTIGQLEEMIAGAFGPVRAEMIAVTEVTRASVQGELALAGELRQFGIEMVEVWQTNNDELVCPICGPRNNKRKGDGWTEEPPAHPRCRCWINLELPEG